MFSDQKYFNSSCGPVSFTHTTFTFNQVFLFLGFVKGVYFIWFGVNLHFTTTWGENIIFSMRYQFIGFKFLTMYLFFLSNLRYLLFCFSHWSIYENMTCKRQPYWYWQFARVFMSAKRETSVNCCLTRLKYRSPIDFFEWMVKV